MIKIIYLPEKDGLPMTDIERLCHKDYVNKANVLIARANYRFDRLIEQLPGKKIKYLSMWNGYLDEKNILVRKPRLFLL